jgi:hypothetical protein
VKPTEPPEREDKRRNVRKHKIIEPEANNKNKYIRHFYRIINTPKKGYQLKINFVNDMNGHLLSDSHNILNMWKITLDSY